MSRTSTKYLATWAWQKRWALIEQLGGKCANCGSTNELELDHITGRDWKLEDYSRWQRIIRIGREAAQGLIQVLCKTCNIKKGPRRRFKSNGHHGA